MNDYIPSVSLHISVVLLRLRIDLFLPNIDILLDQLDLHLDLVEFLLLPFLKVLQGFLNLLLQKSESTLLVLLDLVQENGVVEAETKAETVDLLLFLSLKKLSYIFLVDMDGSLVKVRCKFLILLSF